MWYKIGPIYQKFIIRATTSDPDVLKTLLDAYLLSWLYAVQLHIKVMKVESANLCADCSSPQQLHLDTDVVKFGLLR